MKIKYIARYRLDGETNKIKQILQTHNVTVNELGPLLLLGKASLHEIDEGYLQDALNKHSQVHMDCGDVPF